MLTLLMDQPVPEELRPDAGRTVLRGNATYGMERSPSPSRPDGNGRGTAGLNLPSEFGEPDSPAQGVKVRKEIAVIGSAIVAHATAVVCFPQHQEHAAQVVTLALRPSYTLL